MNEGGRLDWQYAPYSYSVLKENLGEIRLADILPGSYDDTIQLIIRHARLLTPEQDEHLEPPITKRDIERTLPADWIVRQTLEGRYMFERVRDYGLVEPFETSWKHPVTHIEPEWRHTDLPSSSLAYEALSYVWGGEEETTAFVETEEGRRTLQIRENLADVLRELRSVDLPRTFWIDALCIDQNNLVERAQQIKRMGDIYRLAMRVVLWLGNESHDSKLAMSKLRYIGMQLERVEGGTWKVNPPGCQEPTWFRSSVNLPYESEVLDAISNILRRPWFERVWVVQEARLGNSRSIVRCGQDEIQLAVLNKAIRCMSNKSVMIDDLRALLRNAEETTSPVSSEPFLFVLQMVDQKYCSDARDKIYGALGLAPLQFSQQLRTNYALPVADVYRDMYSLYLQEARRTDFLLQCQLSEDSTRSPTWLPGWSKARVASSLLISFQASGISMSDAQIVGGQVLEVGGVRCGIVDFVANEADQSVDAKLSALREWLPDDLISQTYVTGESNLDAFVKTISMHRLRERYPITRAYPTLANAKIILQKALDMDHQRGKQTGADSLLESQLLRLLKYQHGHFIRTKGGHFGQTTAPTAAGDIICCLLGCPSPMILRPTATDGFLVVGCAFVYGLMDAEALLGPLAPDWCIEKLFSDQLRRRQTRFCNKSSGAILSEDPRLGACLPGWDAVEIEKTSATPINSSYFRHNMTGNIINGDPRLLPSALGKRGIKLERFALV